MADLIRAAGSPQSARRVPAGAVPAPDAPVSPPPAAAPATNGAAPVHDENAYVQELQARIASLEKALAQRRDGEASAAREEGYAAGQREGRAEFDAQLSQLQALLAAMDAERAALVAAAEDDLVEIAMAAIATLLGAALAKPSAARAAVTQALDRVRADGGLTVRLAPGDRDLLQPVVEKLRREGRSVELIGDARVELGGCLIDTDAGTLDARLESQLGSLKETLLRVRESRR